MMYKTNTYTFGTLKKAVYQALEAYSVNGEILPPDTGLSADTEKKFVQTLNMCVRRVCLYFPLLEKNTALTLEESKGGVCAYLPQDFLKVLGISENGNQIQNLTYRVSQGRIFLDGISPQATVELMYGVNPGVFTETTLAETPVLLPDLSADALICLTAAELCSNDEAGLYTKLMYQYRDLALNVYHLTEPTVGRNRFYQTGKSFLGRCGQ